jgi:hypothetical protein
VTCTIRVVITHVILNTLLLTGGTRGLETRFVVSATGMGGTNL